MVEAGLRITLNTDDPAMFRTDVGHTYRARLRADGWGRDRAKQLEICRG